MLEGKALDLKKISNKPKIISEIKKYKFTKINFKNLKKYNLNEISIFVGKNYNYFEKYRTNKIKLIEEKSY